MSPGHAPRIIEKGVRVQAVVAQEFPHVPVKLICSTFDGSINNCARRCPKLGGVGPGLYAKLLQSVRRRLYDLNRAFLQIGRPRIVVHPVQREVILCLQIPVRTESVRGLVVSVSQVLLNARFQQRQVGIPATIQGKVTDLSFLYYPAHIGGLCIQQRDLVFHLHHLCHRT